MEEDKTSKKIAELDASILDVMSTLYELTNEVRSTKENAELTSQLMKTLQEYLYVVVKNFRNIESILEKERILKSRWKAIAFTLGAGYGIFILLVIFGMYAPR